MRTGVSRSDNLLVILGNARSIDQGLARFSLASEAADQVLTGPGPAGQGRIRIQAREVERLKDLLSVRLPPNRPRRLPSRPDSFPGITVVLGRPDR